jgi:signal transduction histidine kinase
MESPHLAHSTQPGSAGRFSARSLLPLGFCFVFLLMAAALVESYRMRERIQAAPAAFAAYDRDDMLVERVRHGFNQTQSVVRAYLLNNGSKRAFLSDLRHSEAEVTEALNQIAHKDMLESIPGARAAFEEHFQKLHGLASWSDERRRDHGGAFIGAELTHLRGPGNRVLRDMADATQSGRKKLAAAGLASNESSVRNILFLLAGDLILALGVAGLNMAYARELGRESLGKVEEIAHAKGEMQQLSGRLLTIQEEERHRLSRELHDGIGQLLTALRIEISHLGHQGDTLSTADRERLQRARSLAEEAVRNTRDIALLLRPSHLDDLGLDAALQWQVEDFNRRTGISCRFAATGLDENDLPDAWKTCVYRIVQESLHNCEKHAAPTHVHIRVCQEAERLTLEVQDDGVGFELNAQGAPLRAVGLGLLGMRERAAMLGGALQIVASPGHGVTIRVELPMSPLPARNPAPSTADETSRREVKA